MRGSDIIESELHSHCFDISELSAECRRSVPNDMATPLPRIKVGGAVLQKKAFCPCHSSRLYAGLAAKKIGQIKVHHHKSLPVPRRLCKGGKAKSNQAAWEAPAIPVNMAMSSGENPSPPSLMGVYMNTGLTAVNV